MQERASGLFYWLFVTLVFLVGRRAALCCWVLHNLAHNAGEGIEVLSPLEIVGRHAKVVLPGDGFRVTNPLGDHGH